jgi:hypothetical protein
MTTAARQLRVDQFFADGFAERKVRPWPVPCVPLGP